MTGARAAFDAGDRTEALRLYELAVAITPNHPEARAGFERARNLETVLQLVERGLTYEEELELDAAETSFARAATLDPNWAPATEGLERVRATKVKMQFDARMSEGLEALVVGDYLAARAAFRMFSFAKIFVAINGGKPMTPGLIDEYRMHLFFQFLQ